MFDGELRRPQGDLTLNIERSPCLVQFDPSSSSITQTVKPLQIQYFPLTNSQTINNHSSGRLIFALTPSSRKYSEAFQVADE